MAESGTATSTADLATGVVAANPLADEAPPGLPEPTALYLLLRRTGYGIREEDWRRAQELGYDGWLEQQLAADDEPDRQRELELAASFPSLGMGARDLIDYAGQEHPLRAVDELRAATLVRRLTSSRQLHEVMVELWSDHFSVLHTEGPVRVYKTLEDREIRRHALGRFGDLLRASARSPAMLYYLDNWSNVAAGPNENYARELLELHTVGAGAFGETDVKAVARAFTGWGIGVTDAATREVGFVFHPESHDRGAKRVLGVDLPAGGGVEDGERVLELLLAHPATATRVSTRLVRRFVADEPPATLVARVAQAFRASGGDVRAMLREILGSGEFKASADRKLQRPGELLCAGFRALGVRVPPAAIPALVDRLARLGHVPFLWPDPDGYPDAAGAWRSAASMAERFDLSLALAEGTLHPALAYDARALSGQARTPAQLVDRLVERVLRRPVAAHDRAALVDFAASGSAIDQPLPAQLLPRRARELVALLLGSPYFQRR
jgi:uncharacterized protein (DUF1800 family)